MGAVYAPALDELYVGAAGGPVWREKYGIRVLCPKIQRSNGLSMATSRFHDHPGTIRFAEANRVLASVPIGAALKYGRLAMGEIDVYPRLVGTSEWDTAAGQIILEAAGGALVDWESGKPMEYGKPNRRNGQFLAFRMPYLETDFVRVWRE
jgi:3'(2'), 5'-bisphosphate nucleotidase